MPVRIEEAGEGGQTFDYKPQQLSVTETHLQLLPIADAFSGFESKGFFFFFFHVVHNK